MKRKVFKAIGVVIATGALLWVAAAAWLVTFGPGYIERRIHGAYPHAVKI